MRLRLLTPLMALVLALALSACGNKEKEVHFGATEGAYLDLGGLKYQVQISRELNPADPEDHGYLIGADQKTVRPDEAWFAVFMRPQNVFAYRPVTVGANAVLPLPDSPAGENTIQGSLVLFKVPFANFANRPLVLKIVDPTDPAHSAEVDLD